MSAVDIAIGITPRENSYERIWAWKQYVLSRIPLITANYRIIKRVVAMPTRPSREIEANLDAILAGTDAEFWASMEPGLTGAGDTFRAACFFAFEGRPGGNNIPVDYVLHVPADVDYGNPRCNDVQENLPKMFEYFGKKQSPDLLIGNYTPMIWENETPKPHPIKDGIEKHVREQLKHYFSDDSKIRKTLCINRPRSEFFMIHKDLFNEVVKERRFSPLDPLPQILIFAEKKGKNIEIVPLGTFYEELPESNPSRALETIQNQVLRTADQISAEWLRWAREGLSDDQVVESVPNWKEKTSKGREDAFKAIKELLTSPEIKCFLNGSSS